MKDKIKIAMVGCGGFAKSQSQKAIEQCGQYQVVACYDVNVAEAETAARRFGARVCDSLEQVLNDVHRSQTEASLSAGKHVFVEKPIANAVADGIAMTHAARAARRVLMVGHNTRRKKAPRLRSNI